MGGNEPKCTPKSWETGVWCNGRAVAQSWQWGEGGTTSPCRPNLCCSWAAAGRLCRADWEIVPAPCCVRLFIPVTTDEKGQLLHWFWAKVRQALGGEQRKREEEARDKTHLQSDRPPATCFLQLDPTFHRQHHFPVAPSNHESISELTTN